MNAKKTWVLALAGSVFAGTPAVAQVAQEKVDLALVQKIRDEGLNRSQVPALVHYLTDVVGPRLTGSHQMKQANEWTAGKLREWGATNVVVEPWGEFGRGWERVAFSGRVVEPFVFPLNAQPQAWTGSTKGRVTAPVVLVKVDSLADLARYHGKLKGAVVVMRPALEPGLELTAPAQRYDADSLLAPVPQRQPRQAQGRPADFMRAMQQRQTQAAAMDSAFVAEGIVAVLTPSSRPYAMLSVSGTSSARDPKRPVPVPTLVVGQEQYGTIWRDLQGGTAVKVELDVQNRVYAEDTQAYNTLGDIAGSDLADQYVMLGGHLDSWTGGTGATDNAAGSVVMMEAVRILKALNLKPRRTIRIGLWSGEEQGLLGSRGWVARHPDLLPKISAYVNVDNGAGKIRGIWDQSNEKAIPVFEQILWPFRDLGVVAVRHGDTGGTDHLAFDAAGVPGFNFIQDPLDYGTRTHHSNVDTWERLPMDDLKQAAVVVAATVWELANRDDMMPRKEPVKAAPTP
ncbi:MAG TPA: M20/M25/M40 family metallo-hydrolase [Longimicrobiales bacterium]